MCKNELRCIDMSINYKKSRVPCELVLVAMQSVQILSVCLDNVSRGLLNCGISVSFSPVPVYLHAQLIQRSDLSIALLMLYLAKWEELRPKKQFWSYSRPNAIHR